MGKEGRVWTHLATSSICPPCFLECGIHRPIVVGSGGEGRVCVDSSCHIVYLPTRFLECGSHRLTVGGGGGGSEVMGKEGRVWTHLATSSICPHAFLCALHTGQMLLKVGGEVKVMGSGVSRSDTPLA